MTPGKGCIVAAFTGDYPKNTQRKHPKTHKKSFDLRRKIYTQ